MTDTRLKAEEDRSFEEQDRSEPVPPGDIVAYNELRSCADLYRMFSTGKLDIQPDFQREVVWKKDEQTRFVDSLVKQLPIPSMCFSLDYRTQQWKVIDGLQRMSSIIRFLGPESWQLSNLSDIHPDLMGATNVSLRNGPEDRRRLFALVEDVSIPITVIRCDYSQKNHMSYLFTIFHRLNSGGVRLNNQEIRNCIYTGAFNDILKGFDASDQNWRKVKARIWGSMNRFRSVEIVLRMLAFGDQLQSYDGNLARFLNEYMHGKARQPADALASLPDVLAEVARLASQTLDGSVQGKMTVTLVEALLVGIYCNRARLAGVSQTQLHDSFADMRARPAFAAGARYAVSSVDNVKTRLEGAIESFGR